ncbi:MAG: WapI family immunity protein [Armatimonadota bacterium]
MIIKDKNNTDFFELHIDRFQFDYSEKMSRYYDLEWLIITIKASKSERTWKATSPCLIYTEIKDLVRWFHRIIHHDKSSEIDNLHRKISFMEPNIELEFIGKANDDFVVRVSVDYEFRPKWAPMDYEKNREPLFIDLTTDYETLVQASDSLLKELAMLPDRKGLAID